MGCVQKRKNLTGWERDETRQITPSAMCQGKSPRLPGEGAGTGVCIGVGRQALHAQGTSQQPLRAGRGGGFPRRRCKGRGASRGEKEPRILGNEKGGSKQNPLTWGHRGQWAQTTEFWP